VDSDLDDANLTATVLSTIPLSDSWINSVSRNNNLYTNSLEVLRLIIILESAGFFWLCAASESSLMRETSKQK
jgi:hypothetical protein